MAVTPIKNAPVRFLESGEVGHNSVTCLKKGADFYQKSECADTVEFEVDLTELDGTELLADPDFDFTDNVVNGDFSAAGTWTYNSGWSYDAGNDEADASTANDTLEQTGIVSASTKYQLEFDVANYSAGTVTPGVGDDTLTGRTADGTYKELASNGAGSDLVFSGSSFTGSIDNVKLYSSSDWTWTDASNSMVFDVGNGSVDMGASDSIATTANAFEQGKYYKVTFTLAITAGEMGIGNGSDTSAIADISTSGTYTYYYYHSASDTTFAALANGSFSGTLSAISITEMTRVGWGLKNFATSEYDYVDYDETYVTYLSGTSGKALVSFDWTTVLGSCVEGCYNIFVGDNNIYDGDFTTGTPWTFSGATYDSGNDEADFPAGVGHTVDQDGIIKPSTEYIVQLEVKNVTGGSNSLSVQLCGGFNQEPAGDVDTNGVYTANGTSGSNTNGRFRFFAVVSNSFSVDNVKAVSVEYLSEPYSVRSSWACTKLLSWTNDDNGFGFDYATLAITHYLRVGANLWKGRSTKEKTVHVDSSGDRDILRSKTFRHKTLSIEEMPQYLHEALDIGLEHDTFQIDGTEYVHEEDEYTPNWRNSSLLAPIDIEVIEDSQDLENSNC